MSGLILESGGENTVSFARKLAESPRFKTLFRDGMLLVEEVAAYLDGPGRDDAKQLERPLALAYAAESMRLTTRLMQLASWLLVQRAFNEGEMTPLQAETEKNRVRLTGQEQASGPDVFQRLPERLRDFTERSLRLQTRLIHLDRATSDGGDGLDDAGETAGLGGATPRGLDAQWDMLRTAFNAR